MINLNYPLMVIVPYHPFFLYAYTIVPIVAFSFHLWLSVISNHYWEGGWKISSRCKIPSRVFDLSKTNKSLCKADEFEYDIVTQWRIYISSLCYAILYIIPLDICRHVKCSVFVSKVYLFHPCGCKSILCMYVIILFLPLLKSICCFIIVVK